MNGLHQIRYMLLHELQHYRHKDALAGYLMTLTGILYWFGIFMGCIPSIIIILCCICRQQGSHAYEENCYHQECRHDTSVLNMLEPDSYEDYGMTLIHFAEKLSRPAFPFAAGLSGKCSIPGTDKALGSIPWWNLPV